MTAKRFEFREINEPPILPKCYDTEKQEYANLFECVSWLNELHEENKALKYQLQQQELEYATTCHRLAEENESLKEENKFLRNKVATYKKGNALLKSTMDKEWK